MQDRADRDPNVDTLITLLRSNDPKKSSYVTALEGITRWADTLKSADLSALKLYASLALAVGLANKPELFQDTDFVKNKSRWGIILQLAEGKTSRSEDELLDLLRKEDLPHTGIEIDSMDVSQEESEGNKQKTPASKDSPPDVAVQMQQFLATLTSMLPSFVAASKTPQQPQKTLQDVTPDLVPSPSDLARNKAVSASAKALMDGVDAMANRTGPLSGGMVDARHSSAQDPASSHQRAPEAAPTGPINYYINWNQSEDESSPSMVFSSRMPMTTHPTSKKKNSFWAPRLQTNAALSLPPKELKEVSFPLMGEYFEAAMRICDRLKESPGLSDAEFINYVEYIRWIFKLARNHTWESVMSYDEAFREDMELHNGRSWSTRPSLIEREHLLNKGPALQAYSGAKRHGNNGNEPQICRNFNKNKCKHGTECVFAHRCLKCKKLGHIISKCPDAESPKEKSGQDTSVGTPGGNRA